MISDPKLRELLDRLERDLEARTSTDFTGTTDEEAWKKLADWLEVRAHMLTSKESGLRSLGVQDLVQNVLIKLQSMETMRRLRAARSIEGYLTVVLRNAGTDLIRKAKSSRADLVSLKWLDEHDRRLLHMRFSRNMTIAEIAVETQSSYSATASKLFQVLHETIAAIERRLYYKELFRQLPMKTILRDLTEEEWSLLHLHVLKELSLAEVADQLNTNVERVRYMWNRLSIKLRTRAKNVVRDVPEIY